MKWNLFIDTAAESPEDIYPNVDGPEPECGGMIAMQHHSLKVYVSQKPV